MKYAGVLGALVLAVGLMVGATACGAGSGAPAPGPGVADAPAATVSAAAEIAAPATGEVAASTFGDDLAFLREHGEVIVLEAPSGGVVALSAKYQGRVMTSGVERGGRSLGYINRDFIRAGKTGTQFDNYGGEDRFWLGPEGGQYALYFAPGQPFDFEKWQTPAAFQEGEWAVSSRTANEVVFTRLIELVNYAGTKLAMTVKRTVRLLDDSAVLDLLSNGVSSLEQVDWVAFETINQITNTGKQAWTKKGGLPSIWILAMYNPSPDTWVMVPFDKNATGEIVNDRYFGKVPEDRLLRLEEGLLLFKCDGHQRSKIGIGPARARPFAGSYSESAKLLTLVHYDKPAQATDYVNSMWEKQDEPYGGDVVNSYNDGPVEPGKPALGGFYEIETSSPAAALAVGESLTHTHRTLHFVGGRERLGVLAKAALGFTLADVLAAAGKGPSK